MSSHIDFLAAGVRARVPSISTEEIRAFLDIWSETEIPRNDHVVRIGDRTETVLFVIRGVLRAYWLDEGGTEYNKTFFTEGMFATPIVALLQGAPSHLGIESLTDVTALKTRFSRLMQLIDTFQSLNLLYRRHLETKWVIEKEMREIRLATDNARVRYEVFLEEYPDLEQRIPLYHIASHLGITNVQLSRIRAQRVKGRAHAE